MDQELSTRYKVIIGVLVVALVIAILGWMQARKANSLGDIYQGVSEFRAQIDAACSDLSTSSGRDECSSTLAEFREALFDYQDVVEDLEKDKQESGAATST